MDISNNSPTTTMGPSLRISPPPACQTDPLPAVDPTMMDLSERFFVNVRREAYRVVKSQEAEHLIMPWGPRIDVVFHPKGTPGIVNGRVRLFARTRGGGDIEIASATITSADAPVALSASFGCDEYVVKASAGTDPGVSARIPESYFYARVYDAGRR